MIRWSDVAQQKMDRRGFFKALGVGLLTLTGIVAVIDAFRHGAVGLGGGPEDNNDSYGGTSYGNKPRV